MVSGAAPHRIPSIQHSTWHILLNNYLWNEWIDALVVPAFVIQHLLRVPLTFASYLVDYHKQSTGLGEGEVS